MTEWQRKRKERRQSLTERQQKRKETAVFRRGRQYLTEWQQKRKRNGSVFSPSPSGGGGALLPGEPASATRRPASSCRCAITQAVKSRATQRLGKALMC